MSLASPTAKPNTKTAHVAASLRRRSTVISWIVLGFGLCGTVLSLLTIVLQQAATGEDLFYLVVYTLFSILGYYLLRFNRTALRTLRFLSWLNVILGGLFVLLQLATLPFTLQLLSLTASGSLLGILLIVGFLLFMVSPVVSLVILIVTNPPEFRALYH